MLIRGLSLFPSPVPLGTNRVESNPTVDDLLQRWLILSEQSKSSTVEELCADYPEKSADLRERLRAVASMISLLGLEADWSTTGSGPDRASLADSIHLDGRASHARRSLEDGTSSPSWCGVAGMRQVLEDLGRGGMRGRSTGLASRVSVGSSRLQDDPGRVATPVRTARRPKFLHEAKTNCTAKNTQMWSRVYAPAAMKSRRGTAGFPPISS